MEDTKCRLLLNEALQLQALPKPLALSFECERRTELNLQKQIGGKIRSLVLLTQWEYSITIITFT